MKERLRINMVFWKTSNPGFNSDAFVEFMRQRNIKVSGIVVDEYRFVTSNDVSRENIDAVIAALKDYAAGTSGGR
jgi:threonine aldolase